MFTLNFSHSRRKAFAHGLVKGLAAPYMLYHREEAPGLPYVAPVVAPNYPIAAGIYADWQHVGDGLKRAIERHESSVAP